MNIRDQELREVRKALKNYLKQYDRGKQREPILGWIAAYFSYTSADPEVQSIYKEMDVDTLVLRSLDDPSPSVRRIGALIAGRRGIESALPRLKELIWDEDEEVQQTAIYALGITEGDSVSATLADALKDPKSSVREAAMEALFVHCLNAPLEPLLEALWDTSDSVRCTTAAALVMRGDPSVNLESILSLVSEHDNVIYGETNWLLEQIVVELECPPYVPDLLSVLNHWRSNLSDKHWTFSKLAAYRWGEAAVKRLCDDIRKKRVDYEYFDDDAVSLLGYLFVKSEKFLPDSEVVSLLLELWNDTQCTLVPEVVGMTLCHIYSGKTRRQELPDSRILPCLASALNDEKLSYRVQSTIADMFRSWIDSAICPSADRKFCEQVLYQTLSMENRRYGGVSPLLLDNALDYYSHLRAGAFFCNKLTHAKLVQLIGAIAVLGAILIPTYSRSYDSVLTVLLTPLIIWVLWGIWMKAKDYVRFLPVDYLLLRSTLQTFRDREKTPRKIWGAAPSLDAAIRSIEFISLRNGNIRLTPDTPLPPSYLISRLHAHILENANPGWSIAKIPVQIPGSRDYYTMWKPDIYHMNAGEKYLSLGIASRIFYDDSKTRNWMLFWFKFEYEEKTLSWQLCGSVLSPLFGYDSISPEQSDAMKASIDKMVVYLNSAIEDYTDATMCKAGCSPPPDVSSSKPVVFW